MKEKISLRKSFLIFLSLLIVSFFSVLNIAWAQESFPVGGTDLNSASEIKPGLYQGGTLGWDEDAGVTEQTYYLTGVKNGQLIQAKLMFSGNTNIDFGLYDEDKIKLISAYGGNDIDTLVWLTGAASKSGKYYLSIKNDAVDEATNISLDLKLVDNFDANSQTDAGETIDKALSISSGTYQGYLVGEDHGTDKFDYYQLSLKKGVRTTVKITPSSQDSINIKVYDVNRTMLEEKTPNNEGEINSLSFVPANDGKYYLGLECYYGCKSIVNYQMAISGAVIPTGGGLITTPQDQISEVPGNISPTNALSLPNPLSANDRDKKYIFLIGLTILVIIIVVYLILKKKPPEKDEPQMNSGSPDVDKKTDGKNNPQEPSSGKKL